ncbi:thiamine biosynthesis protein ThiS [Salinivibrio kushneri]|nr:thiamine biosynthesis protein ThiS [Salinivibrio kushneri]
MQLIINDAPTEVNATTVAQLIEEMKVPAESVAVALNQTIIARDAWSSTSLTAGDSLAVFQAIAGG